MRPDRRPLPALFLMIRGYVWCGEFVKACGLKVIGEFKNGEVEWNEGMWVCLGAARLPQTQERANLVRKLTAQGGGNMP